MKYFVFGAVLPTYITEYRRNDIRGVMVPISFPTVCADFSRLVEKFIEDGREKNIEWTPEGSVAFYPASHLIYFTQTLAGYGPEDKLNE